VDVLVAGERVSLLAERAMLWRGVLHVADVHLGKGDHFRARGLPLPPGELADDLGRLDRLVRETGAHTVRVLGDFVHGTVSAATREAVCAWRERLPARVQLVPGNHDRHLAAFPAAWGMEVTAPVLRERPFRFVHAPGAPGDGFEWAGHVHPTAVLGDARERLRFPAFVIGSTSALVPAFSRFSGGPVVRPAEGLRRFVCADDGVVALDG
jgi:DNA ligase-associated metallophosphoesterase